MLQESVRKRSPIRGVSLTELLIGLVAASILVVGALQMMKTGVQSSKRSLSSGQMELAMGRFVALMTNDLSRAGSDPRGQTLQGYIFGATCTGKLLLKYGINPRPASSSCATAVGDIGILSYTAYDANGDGVVDAEEGIDLVSTVATLRTNPTDNVVYQLSNHSVLRKNLGDPDTTSDDSEAVALTNVVAFVPRYLGYDDSGVYGEITDFSRYDDIREVEIHVTIHAGRPEEGYVNPALPAGDPFRTYRTLSKSFRVPLIVRKE